jgi:hypothetical protein
MLLISGCGRGTSSSGEGTGQHQHALGTQCLDGGAIGVDLEFGRLDSSNARRCAGLNAARSRLVSGGRLFATGAFAPSTQTALLIDPKGNLQDHDPAVNWFRRPWLKTSLLHPSSPSRRVGAMRECLFPVQLRFSW